MARNPNAQYSASVVDFSGETSNYTINVQAYNVLTIDNVIEDIEDLNTAIDAIILGERTKDVISPFVTKYNTAAPTNTNAQRERKWSVRYQDVTTFARFSISLPCADLVGRLVDNSDRADLTNAGIAAFVTAFEAVVVSPDGNPVNVLEIVAVGRYS